MFGAQVRLNGLEVFAKHRIREGIKLAGDVMEPHKWGKRNRITRVLKILEKYGSAAKPAIPDIKKAKEFLMGTWERKNLTDLFKQMDATISKIEKGKDPGPLRSIR